MKSCLVLNWLKFHHIIHDTTASTHQQVTLYSGLWLIACCKLAPTLTRQKWRHDAIGRNEYLIHTLSECTIPWVYSLQLLFKSTHHSRRYERKCEWVFFFWTQCVNIVPSSSFTDDCMEANIKQVPNRELGLFDIITFITCYYLQSKLNRMIYIKLMYIG